jgi:SAM-dependent methyltransferase
MHLEPGYKVLDLGCGPGIDTLALSHIVGPQGEVHGADYDAAMVAEAQQRAEASGVSAWVSHREADASALPWVDAFFDASRSERVFQHLLRPEQAFAEMVRVTRPGGWVVVLDSDWGTFTIDSDEAETERRLVRFHAEHKMNNPYSGRMLHRLFRSQQLQQISVEVCPVFLTDYGLARKILRLDQMEGEALAAGAINDSEALASEPRARRCAERLFREHQCRDGSWPQRVTMGEAQLIHALMSAFLGGASGAGRHLHLRQ